MRSQIAAIILLLLSAGIAYLVFSPSDPLASGFTALSNVMQKQEIPETPEPTGTPLPAAVVAARSYAAKQFEVTEDQVTIVSTEKQTWDTVCLGLDIKDYDCSKQEITGYEATFEINGQQMTYRSSDDGQIIRFVKR